MIFLAKVVSISTNEGVGHFAIFINAKVMAIVSRNAIHFLSNKNNFNTLSMKSNLSKFITMTKNIP